MGVITFLNLFSGNPRSQAIITMGFSLFLGWCVYAGRFMLKHKDAFRAFFQKLNFSWPLKFVLACTALALIEEMWTTSLTNVVPPLFGLTSEEVYITASTNYFEVVLRHSVITFVPMFCAWAWLLDRYKFTPGEVFLLYGFVGLLAESSMAATNIFNGMWVFVYGLFVFWPAYALPERAHAIVPRFKHYVLAIILPIISPVVYLPLAILMDAFFGIEMFPGK
jgi:hypothetical protein